MKRVLQAIGVVLIIILVLAVILVGYVFAQSNAIINQTYDIDVTAFELPEANDETIAEGRRIFVSRGCIDCHGEDGGGFVMAEDAGFGTIIGPNLSGGAGSKAYTTEDYMRAILHGVSADGRGLQIMPSLDYTQWREEDLGALLVYLENMEPVDRVMPAMNYGPVYRALIVFNQIPVSAAIIDHDNAGLVDVEAEADVAFGEYLSATCVGCHASDLAGGTVPGSTTVAPNLTPHETGLAGWTLGEFQTAIQSGLLPDGTELDAAMPVKAFQAFTDTEVEALYLYLMSLEPIAYDG